MRIKTENIFQVIEIAADPNVVYNTYMDSKQHEAFTGMTANIEPHVGGKFETCNGRNSGFNLSLSKGQRIVQAWTHRDFPELQYSIVDITLEKTDNGTRVHFNHLALPASCDGWLTEGWHKVYWGPLKTYLEKDLVNH
jgi:activator of HSP90 ATPase